MVLRRGRQDAQRHKDFWNSMLMPGRHNQVEISDAYSPAKQDVFNTGGS
jgi:hypothetical protein